jgi:signal transduction histidine kinase
MKTPDRFNKPYFYLYLLAVLVLVSLASLVFALVFGQPLLGLLISLLLGLLALLPLGSALERLGSGLGRLEIGQPPQLETRRDFWNPLAGLLRQLNRLGRLAGRDPGLTTSLAEQQAAQQERNRLGRDLHDSIKQQLFSIQMSAAAVQARWEEDPQGARSALQDVLQSSQAALAEMNALLQSLSPVPLERVGLAQALRDQCEALAYRSGAEVLCQVDELPAEDWLPAGAFETLFRVAQEALSNIARHARAKNVNLQLSTDPSRGLLVLKITDDGLGFDPAGTQPGGGLNNMRARLEGLGGSFSLHTGVGQGLQLLAALPVHPPEQEQALTPLMVQPFFNRMTLVGLGAGLLCAGALIFPVYDSIGGYLDWGWQVSRALATGIAILAMLIGVLAGFLAARWTKPASLLGSALSGALTGLIGGITSFGLLVAGFAAVDGGRGLLEYGLQPASVARTADLLYTAITGQFQAIHRFTTNMLILGLLYGACGGLLAWRKAKTPAEGIAWEGLAGWLATLLALGSGLALVGGTPAILVSENALMGMVGQAGLANTMPLLQAVFWVLGWPFLFFLIALVASYGLLRRELVVADSAKTWHLHWRSFNLGLLVLIVAAGMGIGLALTLGDAPVFSASLALGIIFVSLVAAVPFFWQAIVIRQRLLGQLVRVPPAWAYLLVAASLLLPVLAFYGLVIVGAFWILPFAMLLEAMLVMGSFAARRKVATPAQVTVWRLQVATGLSGWLAGAFALSLPVLPMLASAVGILCLPVSFANVLDGTRLVYDASVGLTVNLMANNTLIYAAGAFTGLLLLAGLAIGLYLLLLALRLAASKKRL